MKNVLSLFIALRKSQRGNSLFMFALFLPLILFVVLMTIEFGTWFAQYQIALRAVDNASYAISQDPTNANLQAAAQQQGLNFVSFSNTGGSPNYVCAQSYATSAQAASGCAAGQWYTLPPGGNPPLYPYYVAVVSGVQHIPIKGFPKWLGNIRVSNVVYVIPAPPLCTGDQFLQFDSTTGWSCSAPLSCPGQYLEYDGTNWSCAAPCAGGFMQWDGGWSCPGTSGYGLCNPNDNYPPNDPNVPTGSCSTPSNWPGA